MAISEYKTWLIGRKREEQLIKNNIKEKEDEIETLTEKEINLEEASNIARLVAEQTQSELSFHISDIVSHALSSIFEEAYKFELKFIQKRGKTEAELSFTRDGNEVDPMTACGGGVVDIASFALRLAMLMLQKHKAPVLILDEPFRFVSADYQEKAGLLLKELSHKLGIQIIMVTHTDSLIADADKVFFVGNRKGKAYIDVKEYK